MPTRDLVRKTLALLFVLAAMLGGAGPASADGPLSLLTTVSIGSVSHDIDLQGNFMYVATERGLVVVDLSTPSAPVVRGSVLTSSLNMGIKVRGQYAYLAGFGGGFKVVNISNPDAPVVVAARPALYAFDVALKDNVAFVIGFAGELFVFDITTPTNPTLIDTLGLIAWKTPGPDASGLASMNAHVSAGNAKGTGVTVKGNVLIATDWAYGRIYYYDVATPASPIFSGTHYAPYILKADIDLDRDTIYMLSAYGPASGIYTVPLSSLRPDVSTAHATCAACRYIASVVPFLGLDQGGMALAPGGEYLVYGGGRDTGEFNVLDVSNISAMSYAASVPIGLHATRLSTPMGVRIDDDRIYFAAGVLGVQIYRFPGLSGVAGPPPPDPSATVASFAINNGAASTTNRVVTLNNTVSGTATQYRASESSTLSGASWLPYGAGPGFTLAGANGTKQVYFQVRGADLVASPIVSDTITLSEPVPNVTLFTINGGAGTTTSRTVTLNNTTANSPTEYRASESSVFTGAAWLPYASAPSFELSPGGDTKRVYFQTRNGAGVSAVRSDTIILSAPKPVLNTLAINGGATNTASRTVTLNHTRSGSVPTEYRASQSSTFVGAVWLPYAAAPTFELTAGNATKRVYFQLRDAEGAVSNVLSDTINLMQ